MDVVDIVCILDTNRDSYYSIGSLVLICNYICCCCCHLELRCLTMLMMSVVQQYVSFKVFKLKTLRYLLFLGKCFLTSLMNNLLTFVLTFWPYGELNYVTKIEAIIWSNILKIFAWTGLRANLIRVTFNTPWKIFKRPNKKSYLQNLIYWHLQDLEIDITPKSFKYLDIRSSAILDK